jgi:glycosyltransferase involved in cell wall biosynthesis
MAESKKITVAQILPTIENGGVERGVFDLSKFALSCQDLEMIVISASGSMLKRFQQHKIKHINLPVNSKNPIQIILNIFRIRKIIKKYDIDICHVRSRAPAWSVYFACKKTRCKFLTTFHGLYSFKGLFSNNSFLKRKYNSIMVQSNLIIAVSNFIKNHIIKEYLVAEDRIKVIHRGSDIKYFNKDNVHKERIVKLIEKLQLTDDKNVILLPGRFSSWKGHNLLLDALERIKSEDFICLMVGKSNNSYTDDLEKKIKEKDLQGKVRILGQISDMPALYMISSVILSTSTRPEAFGRIAIEAGAMEKIIIATNLGGAKETVINGETGFLFDHKNPSELCQKIQHTLSLDLEKRQEMGKKARKRVEEYFSSEKMMSDTVEIYKNIIVKYY